MTKAEIAWQLIETAPKDGRAVLAWREGWGRPEWVRWALNSRTGKEFWNDADEQDAYELEEEPPTHWISLPPMPAPDPTDALQVGSGASAPTSSPGAAV